MPAKYPLQSLLRVRLFREDAAKSKVALAEKKLRQQQELLANAKEETERYLAAMDSRIEAEYAKIIGKPCKLEDIEKVKHQVAIIEQGLLDRQMQVLEEENKVKVCEEEVAAAKAGVILARKEAAKIETHKGIWQELEKLEAARLEDLEMEEFTGAKPNLD